MILALLIGPCVAAVAFGFGWRALLVPLGAFLVFLVFANPRVGLALAIVAAINFGSSGRVGSTEMLVFPSVSKMLGLITLAAWLTNTLRQKKAILVSRQTLAAAAFVACGLASVAYAQDGRLALADGLKLAANFVLYFLVANLVETPRHLRQFVFVIILTGFIAAAMAVLQYALPAFQLSGEVFFKEFGQHEGGVVTPEPLEAGGFVRPTGTLGDPNWLALFLVTILALDFYVLRPEEPKRLKAFVLVVLAFELAALVMTHNRTGLVGMVVVFVLLVGRKVLRITTPRVVLLSFLLVLSVMALPRSYRERVFSVEHYKRSASILTRWDLQVNGLRIFLDHWLLGVGQGHFGPALMKTNSDSASDAYWLTEVAKTDYQVYWMGAHNMYLEVAAETGVIGLCALLVFLALGISDARRVTMLAMHVGMARLSDLAKVVQISLIAFCVVAVFLHAQDQKIWWILMGFSAAMRSMVKRHREDQGDVTPNEVRA